MALQQHPAYQPEHISRDTLDAVSQGRGKKSSENSEDDAEEVNEALMQSAITDHGRHPYRYGIASVNFKGDTNGTGNAALRKLLLGQLQRQTHVSIVFVQECPWSDPVKPLQLKEKLCYTGLINEAGIIWNSELFELKRLDSYKLIGDKYPNLIQHRGRVCISEMTIKDQPTISNIAGEKAPKPNVSDFIAISWHGPHKCAEAEKQRIFRDLLDFLKTQTKNGQKAFVIGGDFNFRLDKASDNIDDSYPGLTIPTSYGWETIDYFIFTSDLINVLHAEHLSLDYDVGSVYTTQDRDRAKAETCKTPSGQIIDHKPVFAVLDLGSPHPYSSPSKISPNPVSSPSKISPNSVSSPSKIRTNPVSSSSKISPNPVSSPSKISPNPVSSPSKIRTNPVSSSSKIRTNPVSSPSKIRTNPVSSPSKIRTRKTAEPRTMDAPDCSTDGNTRSGATGRNEARQATNTPCGLSRRVTSAVVFRLNEEELSLELRRRNIPPAHAVGANSQDDMMDQLWDEIKGNAEGRVRQGTVTESDLSREVSLAVLPRLNAAELRQELRRRNITPAGEGSQESLMKQLCDEMIKEYFSQQASSVSLENTRNAPMQEVPAGTEETSEAAPSPPVQETPSGGMGTVEEGEPTEAKGTSDVGAQETRDDGQMQKPLAESSTEQWNKNTSSSAHKKRKQAQDTDNERSAPTKKSNRDEETTTIKNLATTGNSVKQEPRLNYENTSKSEAPGTGAGPGSSAPTGMSNAERSGPNSPIWTGTGTDADPGPSAPTYMGMPNAERSSAYRLNRFLYLCPYEGCTYNARSPSDLEQHERKHTGEKPHACDVCGFKTAWSGSLKSHKTRQHPTNVVIQNAR